MSEVYRPLFGRVLTVIVAVIAATALVAVLGGSGPAAALQALPWLACFVLTCWAVFWRPQVVVSDAGVQMVNVTRTIDVPWPALVDVRTKFALTLVTAYGTYTAWAAPAPSAHTAVRSLIDRPSADRVDGRPLTARDHSPMSDRPDTPSGDAAAMVRRRWEHLREAGFLDDPRLEFAEVPVTWHVRLLLGVVALVAVGVAMLPLG